MGSNIKKQTYFQWLLKRNSTILRMCFSLILSMGSLYSLFIKNSYGTVEHPVTAWNDSLKEDSIQTTVWLIVAVLVNIGFTTGIFYHPWSLYKKTR